MANNEQFSGRWGIILASLGMAIGAGNLWRFPRLAGQYGGSFLILWLVFLLIWSIPILLAEFSMGKKMKASIISSFKGLLGKHFAWMGFFVTCCALGIAFYYSVVTGWGLRYLWLSLTGIFDTPIADRLDANPDYMNQFWTSIHSGSYVTLILHIVAVVLGVLVLIRGIQKGLEKANRILIPSLFVLLIIVMATALTMPNGVLGLEYMFSVDLRHFSNPTVWIEALSQSAWSTGAGWGLMLTISSYSRQKEDVSLNIFVGAFGNNTASLVAGMAILPAVFAMAPSVDAAEKFLGSGSQALTFTIIPQLFARMPGGAWLSVIFFLAFFLAAFSSLLPMIELFIRTLTDFGISRKVGAIIAGTGCVLFGAPSAWSLQFFENQDWVWGIGLIISGLFFLFGVFKYGMVRYKRDLIDTDSDFKVFNGYFYASIVVNLFLAFILIWWWMSRGYSKFPWFDEAGNWNLFDTYSNASVVTQWGAIILLGIIINIIWVARQNKTQSL